MRLEVPIDVRLGKPELGGQVSHETPALGGLEQLEIEEKHGLGRVAGEVRLPARG